MIKKDGKYILITLFFSYLSSISLFLTNEWLNLQGNSSTGENRIYIVSLFMVILFVLYYKHGYKSRLNKIGGITALVLGIFMVFGTSFLVNGNWNGVIGNKGQLFKGFVLLMGYTIFFYWFLSFFLLEGLTWCKKKIWDHGKSLNQISFIFDKYGLLFTSVFLVICWLPYLIAFFPGPVNWDGLRQLDFFVGSLPWTTHHPVFSTILMGISMEIGRFIWNSDNIGIFIYTALQVLISISIICYGIKLMSKWHIPYILRIITLIFYGCFTVIAIYTYTLIKDTSYYLAYFMYLMIYITILENRDKINHRLWILYNIFGLLVCLLRNDGIYLYIISSFFLILMIRVHRIKGLIYTIFPVAVTVLFNLIVSNFGISSGSISEMLSIPFQQTARYIVNYEDEITDKEKEIINSILDYQLIKENYDPDLSDPVKVTFKDEASRQELKDYFKLWLYQFKKHPGVYIQATINNTYGYFYPGKEAHNHDFGTYFHATDPYVDRGDFNFTFIERTEGLRSILRKLPGILSSMPVIGCLYLPAFYTWSIAFLGFIIIEKRIKWQLVSLVPDIIIILICIASPVNGDLRYMLPIIFSMPLLFAWNIKEMVAKHNI